jgi:hypothetical protein
MKLAKYKACICEGAAEAAIMDILVDNELLIFSRNEMLDESVIRCRSAQRFLQSGFANGRREILRFCTYIFCQPGNIASGN